MSNYVEDLGKIYHFENIYEPELEFSKIYLRQAGELIVEDGYVINEHIQGWVEISYVVSGCCNFYSDGKVFHAKQGDIHVVTNGMRHRIEAVGDTNTLRMAYIAFRFRDNTAEMNKMKEFYSDPPQVLCNDRYFIRTLFDQLLYEIYMKQSYSLDSIEAYITQIMIHTYRVFQQDGKYEGHRVVDEARLRQIIGYTVSQTLRYIDHHIDSIKGVSQIAAELKYNPAYLSRVFKEKMGITMHHYINEKKVKLAKELLKNGRSVNDTAIQLGYSSSQSFCKMFSRYTGCSPSAFLKQEREQH